MTICEVVLVTGATGGLRTEFDSLPMTSTGNLVKRELSTVGQRPGRHGSALGPVVSGESRYPKAS